MVDSLKALDPKRPIREADMPNASQQSCPRMVIEQIGVAGISRAPGARRARVAGGVL